MRGAAIRTKLELGDSHDPAERQADEIAEQITTGRGPPAIGTTSPPLVGGAGNSPGGSDQLGRGERLPASEQEFFEHRLGISLDRVRVHDSPDAWSMTRGLGGRAFAVGNNIAFSRNAYAPGTQSGRRLLGHEIVHTLQTRGDNVVRRQQAPSQDTTIDIDVVGQMDSYQPPGAAFSYHVGDAAGPSILMQIEAMPQGGTVFRWFNFAAGQPVEAYESDWNALLFITGMFSNSAFATLGHQLPPADWRALWPDPMPALLSMHDQGKINLPDEVIVTGYKGMIFQESLRSLADNEQQVDALLQAPDKVQRLQQYATGLREASVIRDALVAHRDQVRHSRVQAHAFTFGIAGNVINTDPYHQLQLAQQEGQAEEALQFWLAAFPMLTRVSTAEIRTSRIEDELRSIKASIVATRQELMQAQVGHGSLDLMDLDIVRGRLQGRLGKRSAAVIEAEDRSRRNVAIAEGVGALALSIGLLFLPGGIFIDAAIGVAMAASAIDRARVLGNAANTGLSIDEGLASQATAHAAEFGAVLAIIGAAIGGAAAGFRILRFAVALRRVQGATEGFELASQVRIAQALVSNPNLSRVLRSTAELTQVVERLGLRLTPAELQGLRDTIYAMRGISGTGSRQRLKAFLDLVWANREDINRGTTKVYNLYSGTAGNAPLTRSEGAYLADLASLARGRPGGAVSRIQNVTGLDLGDQISAAVARAATDPSNLAQIRSKFFMFFREGAVRNGKIVARVGQRVYLNVAADRATEVMQAVVQQIVDNPQNFPGVAAAKLTGPGGVASRADAIVIYMDNEAASGRVLDWMRNYQSANPSFFQAATPHMTEGVLAGVSVGAEPVASGGEISFGSLRSNLIQQAVKEAVRQGLTREQFAARVDELFRAAKINPDLPHANLP